MLLLQLSFVQHPSFNKTFVCESGNQKRTPRINDAAEHTTLPKKYKPAFESTQDLPFAESETP